MTDELNEPLLVGERFGLGLKSSKKPAAVMGTFLACVLLLALILGTGRQAGAAPVGVPEQASSAALNLSNSPADSRNPALAVGVGDTRSVVWEEVIAISPTLSVSYLRHRAWTGAAWSGVVTVSTGTHPAMAIGPDGSAHLTWIDDFGGSSQVFYSHWNGSTWSVPKMIAPALSGDATAPAIAVNASNTIYVTWGQFQASNYVLYYATSTAAGTGAWTAQSVPNGSGDAPGIAIDAANIVYLCWQQSMTGTRDILYSTLVGNTWSLPENVSQSPSNDSLTPAIELLPDGRPLVAWSELLGGAQLDVESSVRTPLGWTGPVDISNSSADSSLPRLDRAGSDAVVGWSEASTPAGVQWAFGNAGGWTQPLPLATGSGDWTGLDLAGSADGTLNYVYSGGLSVDGDVFYNTLTLLHTYLPVVLR